MQWRHRPQVTWPSPLTRSPGWKSLTFEPTSTISPTNSCPTTSGGSIVFAAQLSHDSMCRSVPQIPVLWTRIRTSLMPIVGRGTSWSRSPGPASALTRASIRLGGARCDQLGAGAVLAAGRCRRRGAGRRRRRTRPATRRTARASAAGVGVGGPGVGVGRAHCDLGVEPLACAARRSRRSRPRRGSAAAGRRPRRCAAYGQAMSSKRAITGVSAPAAMLQIRAVRPARQQCLAAPAWPASVQASACRRRPARQL